MKLTSNLEKRLRESGMMDQQLIAFVTVVEHRSFTRAAEILHTTQPAVSQSIQTLERRMNVRLLDRSNKHVRLNKAGEVVYHYAKEILREYTQMNRLVDDLVNEVSGSLSIGASLSFGEYILPHAMSRFLQLYPDVDPTISIENTRDVVEHVANGRLDIGIIEGTYSNDDVDILRFAEDTVLVVAAAAHPLAHAAQVLPDQLDGETWIVREPGSGTREVTDGILTRFGIRPAKRMEFGSIQVIKESVEAGLGVTVLSRWVIRKELALRTLSAIRLSDLPIVRQFSIVTRKSDFQTKTTQLFGEFLREQTGSFMEDRQ